MQKFGAAAILCGGKSNRMGFDKCKIRVNNKLLIELMGEKLEDVFQDIILLADDKLKFDNIKYKVYEDAITGAGPIGAIYSVLKYAASEYVFVTACDMPVINNTYIKYMMRLIEEEKAEGVVTRKSIYIEPLYAFYSKHMLDKFEAQLHKQDYKLLKVIQNSNIHYVDESEVRKYSSDMDIFTNLNYEADLPILDKIFSKENSFQGKVE